MIGIRFTDADLSFLGFLKSVFLLTKSPSSCILIMRKCIHFHTTAHLGGTS